VAFNQNAYLTFDRVPAGQAVPYDRFELAITVSEDSAEYLRFAFDGLRVSVVPNAIDPTMFTPSDAVVGRRIALMPRKRPDEADQVLRLLGRRLDGWEVDVIEGGSERDTAERLRAAAVFLAFGHREGFGLPAAEAMASGCYVIGFPAFGGREIFDPAFSCPVEDGDVLAMARATAGVLEQFEREPASIRRMGADAMAHIRRRYAPDRQRTELLRVFGGLS
jgi:glycosyltransferase involved in cell wall biosynthesis